MTRRRALWAAGAAGLAGLGSYAWFERRGLVRADIRRKKKGLMGLIEAAGMAPSRHNSQPWNVRLSEDAVRIGSDRGRWLPMVDPENRELALSVGAFLENFLQAAPGFGYAAEYGVTGLTASDAELIWVGLKKTAERYVPLDRIASRRTLRAQLGHELSGADVKYLLSGFEGRAAYYPAGSREGRYLAAGTVEANRVQAMRDDAQEELAGRIRWNDADARLFRNGLTPEAMEITGAAGWYVRHFLKRDSVMTKEFRDDTVARVRDQVGSCGGWLVVTSLDTGLAQLIETGRRVERMWLGVRERGIAVHPMMQILEEAEFQDRVAGEIGLTGPVQFVLRVGYVDRYPAAVSLRMPAERLITG